MRFRDDRAQWLLLSAIVVSIGLGALALLLNAAVLTGHSSTRSITDFPKDDIRDLRSLMISQAIVIGGEVNQHAGWTDVQKIDNFSQSYGRLINDTADLYLLRGAIISVHYTPRCYSYYNTSKITNVSLNITYYDRSTLYTENKTVGISG